MDTEVNDAGGRYYAMAARALNHVIDHVHNNRLTRQQAVMFCLSDMMTYVEVGAALARKAYCLAKGGDGEAPKYKAMARVFAGEATQVVGENALKIVTGTAATDQDAMGRFMAATAFQEMLGSRADWVADMDKIADIIFER